MPLLPEQQQALDYARKRGTEAPAETIRSRVAATYAELEALIEALPADVAREHRETSLWSIQEVVDHLIESERPGIEQLAQLLAGRDVDEAIPASLQSANPLALDWSALRHELHRLHQDLLSLLATATDHLPLTATAAVEMVVKCAQPDGSLAPVSWRARVDWKAYSVLLLHAHNRQHIAQIQRILNAPSP